MDLLREFRLNNLSTARHVFNFEMASVNLFKSIKLEFSNSYFLKSSCANCSVSIDPTPPMPDLVSPDFSNAAATPTTMRMDGGLHFLKARAYDTF